MVLKMRVFSPIFLIAITSLVLVSCASKQEARLEENLPEKIIQPQDTQVQMPLKINPQSEVCRSCHMPGAAKARDFSTIYDNPKGHHPFSVQYPMAGDNATKFSQPKGRGEGIVFFDTNGNGSLDGNEIVLFGSRGEVTVECSTCHSEHGGTLQSGKNMAKPYLRMTNEGSTLCETCHNQ